MLKYEKNVDNKLQAKRVAYDNVIITTNIYFAPLPNNDLGTCLFCTV